MSGLRCRHSSAWRQGQGGASDAKLEFKSGHGGFADVCFGLEGRFLVRTMAMTGSWRPEVPPANTNTLRDSESKRVTYLLVGTVGRTSLMTQKPVVRRINPVVKNRAAILSCKLGVIEVPPSF